MMTVINQVSSAWLDNKLLRKSLHNEANTFYNLFESHFKVLQPASAGQEDLRLKT